MRHTAFKPVLLRLTAILLLFMGAPTANAQYYMNVFHKNGTKSSYLVSDLDSVTFTVGAAPIVNPAIKKNVSRISLSYVENYPTTAMIGGSVVSFSYDSQNRVTSLTSRRYGTAELDYSKKGSIIVTTTDDTLTYNLDQSGLVNTIITETVKELIEYNGEYVSKMTAVPIDNSIDRIYFSYVFKHDNGVLTNLTINDKSADILCRYNYDNPLMNVDLNWFILSGDNIEYAPMWLGYCGKLSDKLLEMPISMFKTEISYSEPNTSEPGTYHFEQKYNELGSTSNLTIEKDADGCPVEITYSVNVEEYIHSYDYVVDSYHRWKIVDGTEKDEPTGNIVGTNDIVYSFDYME